MNEKTSSALSCATNHGKYTESSAYRQFLDVVKCNCIMLTKEASHLFTTSVGGLSRTYLAALPDHMRQEHNCRTCKKFIDKYGGLVTLESTGKTTSVLWSDKYRHTLSKHYSNVLHRLKSRVERAAITGILYMEKNIVTNRQISFSNKATSGVFRHLSIMLPERIINNSGIPPYEQKENFRLLSNLVETFDTYETEMALDLLRDETLFRSSIDVDIAKWFCYRVHYVLNKRKMKFPNSWNNALWGIVADVPLSIYFHICNSMLGTLLSYIKKGLPPNEIKEKFEKMINISSGKYTHCRLNSIKNSFPRSETQGTC